MNAYKKIMQKLFTVCIVLFCMCSLDGRVRKRSRLAKKVPDSASDIQTIQEQPVQEKLLKDTEQTPTKKPFAYLENFLKPWEIEKPDELIEINFENAELTSLINFFEAKYGLLFILDTVIQPLPQGGKSPVGTKFSFTTNKPMDKKQAWDLFVTFLDIGGFAITPGPDERTYRITTNDPRSPLSANLNPLPTFIGVDPSLIPNNDTKIRYVYFVKNAGLNSISALAEKMIGTTAAAPVKFDDLGALVITDKASNIRSLLEVITQLDKASFPETLVIVRLQNRSAEQVKALYDQLVKEEQTLLQRINATGGKKSTTGASFTENVRMIAEKRTNSLILLGPRGNVDRLVDFIRSEIDRDIDLPYSPLRIYPLKFVSAENMAQLLNDLKNFQGDQGATSSGGRYLKQNISIAPEKATNSLIINADYDDYLQIADLLDKIDVEQPQVALRILVLDLRMDDLRQLGTQYRNMIPGLSGLLGQNVNFQTSGLPINETTFSGIVQNTSTDPITGQIVTGAKRLLGDLVTLATGMGPGTALFTLGQDSNGVWGILKLLQTVTQLSVVAKPFLVVTNKYNASIKVGEIRRVVTATIQGATVPQEARGDLSANLTINVMPQISPDGLVTLTIDVENNQFTSGTETNTRTEKKVVTSVIMENHQVLALGGLVREVVSDTINKVPILGDIPVLGWLFKSRSKLVTKSSLLILVSADIVQPQDRVTLQKFTQSRFDEAEKILCDMVHDDQVRDPVTNWFFKSDQDEQFFTMEDFRLQQIRADALREFAKQASKTTVNQKAVVLETSPLLENNQEIKQEIISNQETIVGDYKQVCNLGVCTEIPIKSSDENIEPEELPMSVLTPTPQILPPEKIQSTPVKKSARMRKLSEFIKTDSKGMEL